MTAAALTTGVALRGDEVRAVVVDPFMDGAKVGLFSFGMLSVSPAMHDLLTAEPIATWTGLYALRVPIIDDHTRQRARSAVAELAGPDLHPMTWPLPKALRPTEAA